MAEPMILIIDDDQNLRKTLADILRAKGYNVMVAENGENGLALLAEHQISLVLIDLGLPDISGLEVLDRIKTSSPYTEAIIMTGNATLASAIEATNRGAFSYMLKPYEIEQLLQLLRHAIGKFEGEHAQRESEEKFRTIFEEGPLGMAIMDKDCRFSKVNDTMCRLLGYEEEELTLVRLSDITCPDDLEDEALKFRLLMSRNVSYYKVEKRCIKKNGDHCWVNQTVSMISGERDKHPTFLVMLEDVTEAKRLESQLLHAQKMEAVGRLAGGVAHDFNNILTVILGFTQLVEMRTNEGDPSAHYLKEITAAAERAAHLTQGLLAFSRKKEIYTQPIDLNGTVRRMEKLLLRMISEEIELKTLLAEQDLIIMADSSQIDQILMNLVTNARDAMPHTGRFMIETCLEEISEDYVKEHGFGKPGKYALLTVSDTGCGMDDATMTQIFDPFFTTKEVGKGTGLGLSIVYGIVKQHNGYISVTSKQGRGTTFRIFFPVFAGGKTIEQVQQQSLEFLKGEEVILIVEDNPAVRKLNRSLLEQFGYRVIEAVDGQDAVAKFARHHKKLNLVLMDVVMPKMNGREAIAEMRKIRPDIKVLFTSGYTSDTVFEKGVMLEEVNFISKPAAPHSLLSKIKVLLAG